MDEEINQLHQKIFLREKKVSSWKKDSTFWKKDSCSGGSYSKTIQKAHVTHEKGLVSCEYNEWNQWKGNAGWARPGTMCNPVYIPKREQLVSKSQAGKTHVFLLKVCNTFNPPAKLVPV